ncbi:TRAP transporter small permease [uncultured Maritimibacter sp.]|jgi:TRAP-type C4-dicarboxylate transport system permease small subunit|uniref:TRAP transporter small permease n=1 Tax=uncultured Maritimibacter sp. TaxID=991866 RepID=UPI00261B8A72|nr:TRAP transporter small permease [uncultured Maritimibacter sp.]
MALVRLDRFLRIGARWLALVGFAGLLALAIMMTADALLRTFFSAPLHGVNDVSAVVMAVVIASCIPANLADRKNITVEVLGTMLGMRVNKLLTLFASLVVFAVILLMAVQFIPFVEGMYTSGRRTWVLAWPIWPWWSVATVFLYYAAIIQASNVIKDIGALFDNVSTRAPEHGPATTDKGMR